MDNVLGLKGYSTSTNNLLIAAHGNGFVNVETGEGYGIPISSTNNVEFEVFLNSLFFQNYVDTPLTFNGTLFSNTHVKKLPLSRYIKQWNNRLYLGYVKIGSTEYPSRAWYSNLPSNDTIQWGYESGTNLQIISSRKLYSPTSKFKTYGLKRGDPLFILTGVSAGQYFIQDVENDYFITVTSDLPSLETVSYWAGGNYIDVDRDDGDYLTWIEENNSQLLFFKRDSLHRYNGTSRTKVRDAVGTTSGRSVQNMHELTIYFHGGDQDTTGFYAYNGGNSVNISSSVQDYIDAIPSSAFSSVVSWREGDLYRAYVGDIENTSKNIALSKVVFTFDYNSSIWSIDPIAHVITSSTRFRKLGAKQTYLGTNDDKIFLTPSGNLYDTSPVPWQITLRPVYPSGVEYVNTFTRVEVYSENAQGVRVQYKLHLKPYDTDDSFFGLGQIKNEKTIFTVPERHNQASGLQIQCVGIDGTESTALIKKIVIYYRRDTKVVYG